MNEMNECIKNPPYGGKKSIYQQIGEAHYIYNEVRWLIMNIGWHHHKIQMPRTHGEYWQLFGKWMDRQYPGHEQYMNSGDILREVVKDDYISKLYQHILKMRGLLTHFFCDVDVYEQFHKKECNPFATIEDFPIFSCGRDGVSEEINDFFIFTFNYYCLKLYNKLADFIQTKINPKYDPFRFDLSLTRGNVTRNLHPRWDFDNYYYSKDNK